jgi:hypothetical protein
VSPAGSACTWLRCNADGRLCTPIDGATSRSYAPSAADQGYGLTATVDGALSLRIDA